MSAKPRRRMRSGSLGALRSSIWAVIEYNLAVIEDDERDHELRQKACNCLVQASLAYGRIVELHDLERDINALERLASGNGHHP